MISAGTVPSPAEVSLWLREYAAEGAADIAVEVFFHEPGGESGKGSGGESGDGRVFLGMRRPELEDPVRAGAFVHAVTASLADGSCARLADAVRRWWWPGAFTGPPHALDLGVVNAWHSVGPARVWRTGAPPPEPEDIAERLATRPELLAPSELPLAVEVAYGHPWPHWLGIQLHRAGGPLGIARQLSDLTGPFTDPPR